MKHSKPLIGLTLDHENGGGYSKMPWYAIRENYCTSVSNAGGVPFPLPYDLDNVSVYINMLDGLVVTGGAFDIDPSLFGESNKHEKTSPKENRTRFEYLLTKGMIDSNKPVLGICGGEQLINVVLGGTLIQHIPDEIENCLEHEQPNPRSEAGHSVEIIEGTLLHKITNQNIIEVNTAHHQAVKKVGSGVVINSYSPDGVIEGIEYPANKFCLGVQWHPEYHVTNADTKIFEAFISSCSK